MGRLSDVWPRLSHRARVPSGEAPEATVSSAEIDAPVLPGAAAAADVGASAACRADLPGACASPCSSLPAVLYWEPIDAALHLTVAGTAVLSAGFFCDLDEESERTRDAFVLRIMLRLVAGVKC